jgi:guanosine-3',5'-bis(diphosphate) 3'-pyrophosphohydrolase
MSELDVARLLTAIRFAAGKHRHQRRKDALVTPYINHPIEVAEVLAVVGGITDLVHLQAAILHDTIEDTQTSGIELEELFGKAVRQLVEEVTDDKRLPKSERKRLQIEHTPCLSGQARQLKLADKVCNVRDLGQSVPEEWSLQRCLEYLDWAEQVVAGCRGLNSRLEAFFDQTIANSRRVLQRPPNEPKGDWSAS